MSAADNVVELYADPLVFLRDFAASFPSGSFVQIAAIHPETGEIFAMSAAVGDEQRFKPFIKKYRQTHGLYFSVAALSADLDKKAARRDVMAACWVHLDHDPRDGTKAEDHAQERGRMLRITHGLDPHPNLIIDSGRGLGAYWRLDKPVPAAPGGWAELEKLNKKLIEIVATAKGTHDVSRLMRLPGTFNYPNAKKRGDGFTKPMPTRVLHFDGGSYARGQLEQLRLNNAEVDALPMTDDVKRLILKGDTANKYKGDRSRVLMAVVGYLVRAGVDDEVVIKVCTDPANVCSAHALAQKDPQRAVERCIIEAREGKAASERVIDEMNREHALIWNGSKVVATREVYDKNGQLEDVKFCELWALAIKYENTPPILDGDKYVNRVDYWRRHSKRRDCDGLVLDPTCNDPRYINFWRGWAVEPNPGASCERWLEHIYENVADCATERYEYLLNYLADAVQRPSILPEVAVVLLSEQEGTGKGTFAQAPGRLYGYHFRQFSSTAEFLGRFNAQLKRALLVYADEATWGGDHQSRGKLYRLITEKTITVEEKFKDASQMKNNIRLIIASNLNWVIPAGADSRRFFVLQVSDRKANNRAHFDAIYNELDAGGYGKLLHLLQTRDLDGVDLRNNFPKTDALLGQKLENAPAQVKFLYNIAIEGLLPGDIDGAGRANRTFLHNALVDFGRKHGLSYPRTPVQFGMFLKDWIQPGSADAKRRLEGHSARDYVFPDLATTRARIAAKLKQTVPWPDDVETWQVWESDTFVVTRSTAPHPSTDE